ncbi:MAG: BPSS1187 family protein [Pyrinomonadaceae bacterium]
MSTKLLKIMLALAALAAPAAFGIFGRTQPVQAAAAAPLVAPVAPTPTPCPDGLACYEVAPGDTDDAPQDAEGNQPDCTDAETATGIGCENLWTSEELGELAINSNHFLLLPLNSKQEGKLLVFLGGGNGDAAGPNNVYPVAARQGYHVIALTYPAGKVNGCADEVGKENKLACFGNMIGETITGEEGDLPGGERTNVGDHPQDSIINRLIGVLKWADAKHPDHGWGRYLTGGGGVDWSRVNLAGFSNGSTHASYMGTLPQLRGVGRVALFAGPNDGVGNSEETWDPATYIRLIEGVTDTRYYGLVHEKNHADSDLASDSVLYEVTKNWHRFGMERSPNRARFEFIPSQSTSPAYFDGAHMLISTDPGTPARDAHPSVIKDRYCIHAGPKNPNDPDSQEECKEWGDDTVGYEPAWRCILGTGNARVSRRPVADAGPAQTVECEGGGCGIVVLDGSGSRDSDCDVLSYRWTGPFGVATGRNPTVSLPVGTHTITLVVSDEWRSSEPRTVSITVADTQPPSLSVTLTPTLLWPANHKMVRIDAVIGAADSCGDAPPQVALTSITSDQPDDGGGDGDTKGDIQDAAFGTFDRTFLLRAERDGSDRRGRTYTVTYTATDASGNRTRKSATVHVPHTR